MRLFWFPYNINGVQARFVGLFVVVTCILGIIFRESKTMQWSIAGMAAGYLLRFFSGANASFLGSLAGIPAFFFEPDLVPGPPKQFAALCGFLFSAIATALLFIAEEGGCGEGCYIAGSAVLGFLSFAAFLESVFDFCVGCVFFGIFVKMGIVPRALLEVADDAWEETNNAVQEQGNLWDWFYTRPPTNERRPLWQLPKPLSSIQQMFAGGSGGGGGSKEAREDGVEMVEKKQERQPETKKEKESRGSSSSSSFSDSDEDEEKSKHDEPKKKKKKKNKHKQKDDGGSSNEEPIEVRMKNAQTYERRWFNGWGQRFRYVPEYQDEELCEKFPERKFKTVLKYKHKDEQREFHFIRNCKPSFAGAIMGLTGVASVWKFADQQVFDMKEGQAYWASMALVAAFFGTLFLVLYLLKIICYPYKIWKDWSHPVHGHFFAAILINILLFAYLVESESNTFAKVLFWIAAPLILLDGMYSAARWFSRRWYVDHINPTWMIPPVGSLVASFVAPILDSDYNDVAWLWFGFGIITWLPIFCIIVQRCITAEELEDKVVPSLFILIAPLALAGSSWVLLRAQRCACNPWQDSPLPEIFFYSSIGLTLIMAMLVLFRFFGRLKFDMAYWGYTFPIATVSLFTLQYHEEKGTNLSQAMAVFGVILISYLVALCFLQTITAVLRRDVFVPDDKWGPLSFTNIWHEAFRYRLPRIVRAAKGMKPDRPASIERFAQMFRELDLMHEEHSKHEDQVLFPMFNEFFPGVSTQHTDEHVRDKHDMHKVLRLLDGISSSSDDSEKEEMISEIHQLLDVLVPHFLAHLEEEETHLQPISRKHFPLKLHKQMVRRIWASSSSERWSLIIPFVLSNQELFGARLRFLKCLRWALPERFQQQIGVMAFNGVSPSLWWRLKAYLPDLVPRPQYGWVRYY